jgi:uncharacterized protein YukE
LNSAVGNVQSSLDSLSVIIATSTDVAVVASALDTLNDTIIDLQSSLASLSATAASESDVAAVTSAVKELSPALDELEASLNSISDAALTPEDLDAKASELNETIESLRTLVTVAIGLALASTVAAIIAVCLILLKRGCRQNRQSRRPDS